MSEERSKLTNLYSRKKQLETEREKVLTQLRPLQSKVEEINSKLRKVEEQIRHIESHKLFISTHAIQRCQERVEPEADEQWIRDNLLTEQILHQIRTLGNGVYPCDSYRCSIVVEDNKCISILTPETKEEYKQRKKKYNGK